MKHLLFALSLLFAFSVSTTAQTLTINAHTAEVYSSQKNFFFPINALYFTYNSTSGKFEAKEVISRNTVFSSDVTNVEVDGDDSTDIVLAFIRNTHVKAVLGTTSTFLPKKGSSFQYKSSNSKLEVYGLENRKEPALWAGHIDSLKISDDDDDTNDRLSAIREYNDLTQARVSQIYTDGDSPDVAAGAAAGASPSVSLTGTGVAGKITLTTGTTAVSTGVLATITLPVTFPNGCFVTLTPGNATTAVQVARMFATTTAGTFVLNASGTALSDSTPYIWYYQVTGY